VKVDGKSLETIWLENEVIHVIDQRALPHEFVIAQLNTVEDTALAIREMWVRGAPLIGVTAAFGMYLAAKEASRTNDFMAYIQQSADLLLTARPTAVNLKWAVDQQLKVIHQSSSFADKIAQTKATAIRLKQQDAEVCKQIGVHGLPLIEAISTAKKGATVHVLTHCNAGWLACVDWGTATSPIYQAFDKGIDIHVWVDETRPRNQGARLTAWELSQHGIPHTVIADNTGGLLMQQGRVDLCIVGTDRTTRTGHVVNKIGTYLKALAAHDNNVPFYVALPSSTIDWELADDFSILPIEERDSNEVSFIKGGTDNGITQVRLTPKDSNALNLAFDITPARLVTALITEKGVCQASEAGLRRLFKQ